MDSSDDVDGLQHIVEGYLFIEEGRLGRGLTRAEKLKIIREVKKDHGDDLPDDMDPMVKELLGEPGDTNLSRNE